VPERPSESRTRSSSGSGLTGGIVTVADGRVIAYEQVGAPAGIPVFVLHGTPGSRLGSLRQHPERVADAGLRVISYDRPGYGGSTRQRGRRVVDCVEDVAAIADELGLERFAATGGSGGGAHVLAVGARLPERVTRVLCVAGGAPYDAPDLDWFEGMDPENVREFGWALEGEATLARELQREAAQLLARLDEDPAALLGGFELGDADRAALQDPELQSGWQASLRESLGEGVWGWVDDDLAFIKPWGFELEELRVPVEIRYGVADVLVPPGHGAWLAAHVPGAVATVDEGGGHLLTPKQHLEQLRKFVAGS
jgi:pimeloyl-ACP methyl ester carboxylesterase